MLRRVRAVYYFGPRQFESCVRSYLLLKQQTQSRPRDAHVFTPGLGVAPEPYCFYQSETMAQSVSTKCEAGSRREDRTRMSLGRVPSAITMYGRDLYV